MTLDENYILNLKVKLLELEEENKFLKSPLYFSEICDIIKGEYNCLLNPPTFKFLTTHKQKSCTFNLNINDIICVTSDGKTKWVYFNEPQSSVDGIKHVSDKLSFTGNLSEFCNEYDKPKIHLCQISRFDIVNIFYYYLDRNHVKLMESEKISRKECDNLSITKKYHTEFINRKSSLKSIVSFQKIDFQGNYIYKSNKLNSFES